MWRYFNLSRNQSSIFSFKVVKYNYQKGKFHKNSSPPCDSYVVNSGKSFSVIEERKHLRKNEKIYYHFRNGYFVTVSQIYIHCIYNFRQLTFTGVDYIWVTRRCLIGSRNSLTFCQDYPFLIVHSVFSNIYITELLLKVALNTIAHTTHKL
jgi:hypothetical protein